MTQYKLIQKLYPGGPPRLEIFYDGQAEVVDDVIIVDKDYWRDELIASRGYEEVPFEDTSSPDSDTKEAPKSTSRKSGGRKKSAENASASEERA